MLALYIAGENFGIYEVSIPERKCIPLLPNVSTFGAIFARDGKSFLYAVSSRSKITIYRQLWRDGKAIGTPQTALELPLRFRLFTVATHTIFRAIFPRSSTLAPPATPTSIF